MCAYMSAVQMLDLVSECSYQSSLSSRSYLCRNRDPNPGIPSPNPSRATTLASHWPPWSLPRGRSQSSLRSASVSLKQQVRICSTLHNEEYRCLMGSNQAENRLFSVIWVFWNDFKGSILPLCMLYRSHFSSIFPHFLILILVPPWWDSYVLWSSSQWRFSGPP